MLLLVVREENMIGMVQDTAITRKNEEANNRKEMLDRLDFTERQSKLMTHEMKDNMWSKALSVLVDEFSDPFHPHSLVDYVYKSKLNHHLESGVVINLKARLSCDLQLNMETKQKDMMERMTVLLPTVIDKTPTVIQKDPNPE